MPPYNRYYTGTTVSRDLAPGEYAWDGLVFQSGRFVLDADLNLGQNVGAYENAVRGNRTQASGFVRVPGNGSAAGDYVFPTPPLGGGDANTFRLRRQEAWVAGMRVAVEYHATTTAGENLLTLPAATASSGVAPDVKRTDFLFLEVWRALVAPTPRAVATVEVTTPQTIVAGDTVTVDLSGCTPAGPVRTFTARAVASLATEFTIGGSAISTAAALAAVINNPVNGLDHYVGATTSSTNVVTLLALFGGVQGNLITLAVTVSAGGLVRSGPTFTGGATRPNRPSDTTIYRKGNVNAPAGVNLFDNMIDPVVGIESTQRVQVQYRLRIFSNTGLNPKTSPDGFSHAGVLAQGTQGSPTNYRFVPADGVTSVTNASKVSSAISYEWVDGGLWIAGNGDAVSAADLGTVDGYVYAIPVCMVFRRNNASASGGFDPIANANGALSFLHGGVLNGHVRGSGPVAIAAGASDRPDGAYHDLIQPADLWDLRRHIAPAGYDLTAEVQRQTQVLLDGEMATWAVDASDMGQVGSGSGAMSTRPLHCNEIGRAGPPDFSGDQIRQFDHLARRFGSQSVVERVVFEFRPAGMAVTGITVTKASGTNWYEGDAITVDFGALNPTTRQNWTLPDAVRTVTANWPAGTRVTDVLSAWHDDGHSTSPVSQEVLFSGVVGMGTPVLRFTLDGNSRTVDGGGTVAAHPLVGGGGSDNGSARRLFIELEITYPTGAGLVRTPRSDTPRPAASTGYAPYNGGPVVEPLATERPAEMDPGWAPQPWFRAGQREVILEQKSGDPTIPANVITDTLVTANSTTLYLPRRLQTLTGATVAGNPVVTATRGSSQRRVTVPTATTGQVAVAVTYRAQDPIPDSGGTGYRLLIYYTSTAPQTAGVQAGSLPTTLLPESIVLEPLATLPYLWTGQTGAGSVELAYPYASALDAIAVPDLGGGAPRDWYFAATAQVTLSHFDAPVGVLTAPLHVHLDMGNSLQLGGTGRGPQTDPEFRAYYDLANPNGYKPTAMGTSLSGVARHKVWVSLLTRVRADTRLFRRGELVLAVISRLAQLDSLNTVTFTDNPAIRTVAALYRTQNLLLTHDS